MARVAAVGEVGVALEHLDPGAGQRGPERREVTSSSVIPMIPMSTSSSAVSASPAARAASTSSIVPAG
jgi:hypothetical protein